MRFAGMDLGTRATIVRLPSKGLVIISPVPFDDELADQIEALGPVDSIIAPNMWHHLYFADACERWPNARALYAPGLGQKCDLPERAVDLAERGDFEDALHWVLLKGAPKLGEHLFVHRDDGVLIVTDAAFHFIDHPQWLLRTFMRLNGAYGKFAISRHARGMVKDQNAFGQSLAEILHFEFDAIVVVHGQPIIEGGRQKFLAAYDAFLPDQS